MAASGARRRFAAPSRRITAYLRLLGRRRAGRPSGLGSLRDEIEPRLRRVVADALGVEPAALSSDVALEADLAVDSLDLLEVLGRVEDAFGVVVPDREAATLRTVDDLTAVTTALVACRLRAREEDAPTSTRFTVRIGAGTVPRFVRTFGDAPYDRELLRDDLRRTDPDQPAVVSGANDLPMHLERSLVRAILAGAEVGSGPRDGRPEHGEPFDAGATAWPEHRLVETWSALIGRLAAERDATIGRNDGVRVEARAATDADVARFRALIETYLDLLAHVRPAIHAAAREVGRLALVRRAVDEHMADGAEIRESYDAIVDGLADAVDALRTPEGRVTRRHPPRAARRPEREELRA